MLVEYPKLLTDAAWKKVEKAAGVSATGVGKTLREAETTWRALAGEVNLLENGKGTPAKADSGKKAMILAFGRSATLLNGLLAKVKSPDKKAILTDYSKIFASLARDLRESFNLVDDHRGMEFVVQKFNAHVKADLSSFKHRV
jgi:hypothetical protein